MGRRKSIDKKVPLYVFIDAKINSKLRSLIQEKYSKFAKGLLSLEVERALEFWVDAHTKAQIEQGSKMPSFFLSSFNQPRIYRDFIKVKDYLLSHYYHELLPGKSVNGKHLREAISNIFGSDKRTIRKYLENFVNGGFIKHIAGEEWEILRI